MFAGEQLQQMSMLVRDREGITAEELGRALGVSERTVRNYVSRANDALAGIARIDHKHGDGYSLHIDNKGAFSAWLHAGASNVVPQTSDERVAYLLNDLLERSSWIRLDDLADMLFVTRRTISNDLRRVEQRLADYGLTIEKRPHHGIRVQGPELSRRLCMANQVLRNGSDAAIAETLPDGFSDLSADRVAACIDAVLAEEEYSISSVSYRNLLVHITVALMRIEAGNYMPMDEMSFASIRESDVYPIAQRIASRVSDELGIAFPEEETAYIAIHLAGKRMLDSATGSEHGGIVVSDEVWDVVGEMLDRVWHTFRFDFRGDLELRMNLARHIVPLAVRLKFNLRVDNPLLADTKRRFSLAYSMACEAASVLASHYDAVLSEEETGYIALAFALALERQKEGRPKKNILVVCASGLGSARLLEYRYREEFGSYIDRIEVCDLARVGDVDYSTIDYVFTTVPINRELPVPVCEVQYFLDAHDVDRVKAFLAHDETRREGALYFDCARFFAHQRYRTRDEAISDLCARMSAGVDRPDVLEDLVRKREEVVSTAFGNRVAMPHPIEAVCSRTQVSVAVLDEPVMWGNAPVQVIFLVAIGRDDAAGLKRFYSGMMGMLFSERAIDQLICEQSFDTLLDLFAASNGEEIAQ